MTYAHTLQAGLLAFLDKHHVPEDATLVVAASGGADSLALALALGSVRRVHGVTIDHGLRQEATREAAWVGAVLGKNSIDHTILALDWPEKPTANIQAVARQARYERLAAWCNEQNYAFLLTAHHREDQAETLLLRLARGSGVYGLAAMAEVRPLSDAVTLMRPLLGVPRAYLRAYLDEIGQVWIEDPSNQNLDFDRVKVRAFLDEPPLDGFSSARLAETALRLRRTREAIEFYERAWLKAIKWCAQTGHARLSIGALTTAPAEIVLRGLSTLVRRVGGREYTPRFEKLERLFKELKKAGFGGQTIGGAQFFPDRAGDILIVREYADIAPEVAFRDGQMWDGRFLMMAPPDADRDFVNNILVRPLGQQGVKQLYALADAKIDARIELFPKLVVRTVPACWHAGKLIAVPALQFSTEGNLWGASLSLKVQLAES